MAALDDAAAVREQIQSLATCSDGTFRLLQSLLRTADAQTKQSNGTKRTNIPSATTRAKTRTKSRTRTKRPAEAHDGERDDALGLREKTILATQVFNATLKVLTATMRPNGAIDCHGTSNARPLQDKSINTTPNPAKAGTKASQSFGGISAMAECARVAVAFMRSSSPITEGYELSQMQVEQGMSALISKLIALGLYDLAWKELRQLRKRLDCILGTEDTKMKSKQNSQRTTQAVPFQKLEKGMLEEMLHFHTKKPISGVLAMAVAFQGHVLRLVALNTRHVFFHEIVNAVKPSNPSSPASLINLATTTKPGLAASKAAQLLYSISSTLMSACPKTSSSQDGLLAKSKDSVSPKIAFQLQVISLQMRILWWNISEHQANQVKELWEPFLKCLTTFNRRSKLSANERFHLAYASFESIKEQVGYDSIEKLHDVVLIEPLLSILANLEQTAREAGMTYQALELSSTAASLTKIADTSPTKQCAVQCKLAYYSLKLFIDTTIFNPDTGSGLVRATEMLGGSMKGSSSELDELLAEATVLKRLVLRTLSLAMNDSRLAEAPASILSLRDSCEEYIFVFLRFIHRYIGNTPNSHDGSHVQSRYEQRYRLAQRVARSSVESALAVSKSMLNEATSKRFNLLAILQDCISVARQLESMPISEEDIDDTDKDKNSGLSLFVEISNFYWLIFLHERQSQQPSYDPLKVLYNSVELLTDRSDSEANTGFLALKQERLSSVYRSRRLFKKATDALSAAIKAHIKAGALSKAASLASSTALQEVWNQKGEISILSRVLASWVQRSTEEVCENKTASLLYDDVLLPINERGILLEWQISLLSKFRSLTSLSGDMVQGISRMAIGLMEIYSINQYPVRRLRLIISLTKITAQVPAILNAELQTQFCDDFLQSKTEIEAGFDTEILRYYGHLRSLLMVQNILSFGSVSPETLDEALHEWERIIADAASLDDIKSRVDDIEDWVSILQSLAEFLDMKGLERLRLRTLQLAARVTDMKQDSDQGKHLTSILELALQSSRLGYSSLAGHELARTEYCLTQDHVSKEASLRWKLAYAEYSIGIGDIDTCKEILESTLSPTIESKSESLAAAVPRDIAADAAYVYSLLSFAEMNVANALLFSRQCVKLHSHVWMFLESINESNHGLPSHKDSSEDAGINSLLETMNRLSLQPSSHITRSSKQVLQKGSKFWSVVAPSHRSLLLLCTLYSHQGLLPEALFYAEQSSRLARAVDSVPLLVRSLIKTAELWARGGNVDKGHEVLSQAEKLSPGLESGVDLVNLHCCRAKLYGLQREWHKEEKAYEFAQRMLMTIGTSFVNEVKSIKSDVDDSASKGTRAPPSSNSVKEPRKRVRKGPAKPKPKPKPRRVKIPLYDKSEISPLFSGLRTEIVRMRAGAHNIRNEPEAAVELLRSIEDVPSLDMAKLDDFLKNAESLLLMALKQMADDAFCGTLYESTLSFPPSVASSSTTSKTTSRSGQKLVKSSRTRKTTIAHPTGKQKAQAAPALKSYVALLQQAWTKTFTTLHTAINCSPTSTIYRASKTMIDMLMLLSAFGGTQSIDVCNPFQATAFTEIARTIATLRHTSAIEMDKELSASTQHLVWPSPLDTEFPEHEITAKLLQAATFQEEFIDILPAEFRVISISLNQKADSLVLSQLRSNETPFILRIPLTRRAEEEEGDFSFEEGKRELLEIIRQANASCHDAKDKTSKGAKAEWWHIRQSLDGQLRNFLQKIESVWLGGFRALFDNHERNADQLSHFSASLDATLDKYLPSRQKRGKCPSQNRVKIDDPRVLDLFIGLGVPSDNFDMEDDLMDLLYYILDILQFQGEQNAYDEVDFDSMIIDIHDALRRYHQAVSSIDAENSHPHTILILDKALQCFPWESMPCLIRQSVSRLPSLGLLQRILKAQQRKPEVDKSRPFTVNRHEGGYILNPGNDLSSTQNLFEGRLESLDGWTGIVERDPTEIEMKDMLREKDLFLYFGHGSGAQYIRRKTIQRLDHCAVAVLMGCSSGALTEAGEFEPYGTPLSYGYGGCPAVVANLWDVTDKDIDRFSLMLLDKWGLFADQNVGKHNKSSKRGKNGYNKKEIPDDGTFDGRISLTEAVAASRDECVLRFLNGAAPVVYGVPMYLS